MCIFLSWIKQQDLAVVILYKKYQNHTHPQHCIFIISLCKGGLCYGQCRGAIFYYASLGFLSQPNQTTP